MATTPLVQEQQETIEVDARQLTRAGYRSEEHAQRALDKIAKAFTYFYYQGNVWNELSDDILVDDFTEKYCKLFKIDVEQFSASQEFAERMEALVFDSGRNQKDIDDISHEIALKYDMPYGIALPAVSNTSGVRAPILARGTAFSHIGIVERLTWHAQILQERGVHVRNSWERLGDRTISVVNTTGGPMALWDYHSGGRMRKFLNGVSTRMDSSMTVEAEEKALELLKTKITASQYKCYVLNGAFPEYSKKSDLHYFFRKGLPVMVMSWHGAPNGRLLACLCLHPYGYYPYTHVGVMTPTDEVLAQLLLMRANEHAFWKKSGQWAAHDPRSGL